MLQQDPQNEPETPVAQIRVKSEELAKAISTIEARRQEEAQRLEGTVVIGDIVEELHLDATPEELWAEIQKQRAQAPPRVRTVRTVRLPPERAAAPTAIRYEDEDDSPIKTLHRSTNKDTPVLIGVIIVAVLLCLLGLAIALTSTPPPPTLH